MNMPPSAFQTIEPGSWRPGDSEHSANLQPPKVQRAVIPSASLLIVRSLDESEEVKT